VGLVRYNHTRSFLTKQGDLESMVRKDSLEILRGEVEDHGFVDNGFNPTRLMLNGFPTGDRESK
jgi:hypothetical protein